MIIVKLTPFNNKNSKPVYLLMEEEKFSAFAQTIRRDEYKIALRKVEDFFARPRQSFIEKPSKENKVSITKTQKKRKSRKQREEEE